MPSHGMIQISLLDNDCGEDRNWTFISRWRLKRQQRRPSVVADPFCVNSMYGKEIFPDKRRFELEFSVQVVPLLLSC
jgi:hypothetical protein